MIILGPTPIESTVADRKRAGQQDNVYAAERALGHGWRLNTIEEAQIYVDGLTASDWWEWPEICRVLVEPFRSSKWSGTGQNYAEHGVGVIQLTKNGLDVRTILHEVAHCVSYKGAGHGPAWVQNYNRIVYRVLGQDEYMRQYNTFKQNGVLFD